MIGLIAEPEQVRARIEGHSVLCGWFIVVTDYDGFANLHGPYWETDRLMEKYETLSLVAHFNPTAQLNVIPVEGIKPA